MDQKKGEVLVPHFWQDGSETEATFSPAAGVGSGSDDTVDRVGLRTESIRRALRSRPYDRDSDTCFWARQ